MASNPKSKGERILKNVRARARHFRKEQLAIKYPKTPKTYRRPRLPPIEDPL